MTGKDCKKVFLLGGHDLEMMTIKEMVELHPNCVVVDKNLQWDNAMLGEYLIELQDFAHTDIYGIELIEDFPLPSEIKAYYHRIDHHNDCSGMPSSLEQVASVLGVELDRHQRLVAANDSGYIPAMRALGATEDEISVIRELDRRAQGVTEEDERLAEKSINENKSQHGSLVVVKSITSKFSPICDRLYPYERLLIHTDWEWMFYGEGKAELVSLLDRDIQFGKVFYGGDDRGYVGCVKRAYRKEEIEQFVEQIKKRYDA